MTSPIQSTVNIYNALGVPGDIAFSGPRRSQSLNVNSNGANPNTIGFAYTFTGQPNPDPSGAAPNAGTCQVGGTGVFAGILVNSKVYASFGTSAGPLQPTLNLADNSIGEFLFMGEIFVEVPGPANIGDQVYFDNTTGALGTQPATIGGTATQSTTTLTVAAGATGNIGIGTQLLIAGAEPVKVLAFGTGTGGAGTYTVDVSQTVGSAAAISGTSAAPSGKTLIARAEVSRFGVAAVSPTGLACIKLTQ